MKFGKYIQSASSEWATPWYMEYKGLKKIISALENTKYTLLAAPPPDDDQALKTAFFYKLDRELDKVDGFYVQKEAQFRIRLRTLSDKLRLYEKRKRIESLKILKEAHVQFINDLAKLQKFVMINSEGFRKILKKYDKRFKSATKDAYMERQVKTKSCFNSENLIELTDIASNQMNEITNLIALLESGNTLVNGNIRDSENSLWIPIITSKSTSSSSEINTFELNEFESNLQECILTNQVSILSQLLEKKKIEQDENGYSSEDLEIMGRVLLNSCNTALLEVFECFLNHAPILLKLGIRDDISDRTHLHELAISGRIKILKLLLEKGLYVDPEDTYGRRPIHYSSMYGHISSSLLLIAFKADIESPDHDGATPLVHAIRGGHIQHIEMLIESGAKLEYASEMVQNPLTVAIQMGNLEVTEMLLMRGVQMLPDSQGLSPLAISCRMGYAKITAVLIKYGAKLDSSDNFYGWQPIFFAASEGHLDCTRELIQAGCRLDVQDESGWFPWTFALYHGHIEVAKLLEDSCRKSSDSSSMLDGSVRPIAPSDYLVSDESKPNEDIENIPSLSLPPPIIPCRIYGHHYLDKKLLIRIQIGSYKISSLEKSPLRLFGSHQLSTLKLEITPKPDDLASYTVTLPLKDMKSFDFLVTDLEAFSVQFDVYPIFGTKSIGRAMALPSIFKILSASSWSGAGEYETCICPLFDSHLNVVGEVEFEFSIIRPFVHSGVQIGGKINTYWKSTTIVPEESNSEHRTIHSFITASSLAEEYLDAIIQVTSDGIPVVYPYWCLPFDSFPVYISSVTYAQAKSLFIKSKEDGYKGNSYATVVMDRARSTDSRYLASIIYDSFLTLEELLQTLPESLGICINVKYPTASQRSTLGIRNTSDAHLFVERILKLVYDNAGRNRSIIFSSFNPSICSIINWKQPNYGVFFGTRCGYTVTEGPWRQLEAESDIRCNSIKEAIKFANSSNLLGLICEASPIINSAIIITTIKESGLLLATCGTENEDISKIRKQELMGVDAIISHRILRYNNS